MIIKVQNNLINKFEAVRSNINEDKELLKNNINVCESIRKTLIKKLRIMGVVLINIQPQNIIMIKMNVKQVIFTN